MESVRFVPVLSPRDADDTDPRYKMHAAAGTPWRVCIFFFYIINWTTHQRKSRSLLWSRSTLKFFWVVHLCVPTSCTSRSEVFPRDRSITVAKGGTKNSLGGISRVDS
jgi:hypothetical protein